MHFIKDDTSGFYLCLRRRIRSYFREQQIPITGNGTMQWKIYLLLTTNFIVYFFLLTFHQHYAVFYGLWTVLGLIHCLIAVNIAHDAVHNAISKKRWVNKILCYSWNLIGANEYVWKITHNQIHHNFPNVPDIDPDIHQSPLIRMSPSAKWHWFHQWQHIYYLLVYSLFGFYLVFVKDFRVMFFLKPLGPIKDPKHPFKEYLILFASKIIYLGMMLVVPYYFVGSLLPVLIGFILMQLVIGILLTLLTAPAHVFLESSFCSPDSSGTIPKDWAVYQLESTIDFSRNRKFAKFFLGGGNMQVIHHLFPSICHIHSSQLTDILENTAKEFNVPYRAVSFGSLIRSHTRMLKKFGEKPLMNMA